LEPPRARRRLGVAAAHRCHTPHLVSRRPTLAPQDPAVAGAPARASASVAAGVCQPSVLRGRVFNSSATAASSSASWRRRSVPFGKYWRSSPLVFSLLGRCHGLAFSQK